MLRKDSPTLPLYGVALRICSAVRPAACSNVPSTERALSIGVLMASTACCAARSTVDAGWSGLDFSVGVSRWQA